jgi:hypothetical protein
VKFPSGPKQRERCDFDLKALESPYAEITRRVLELMPENLEHALIWIEFAPGMAQLDVFYRAAGQKTVMGQSSDPEAALWAENRLSERYPNASDRDGLRISIELTTTSVVQREEPFDVDLDTRFDPARAEELVRVFGTTPIDFSGY